MIMCSSKRAQAFLLGIRDARGSALALSDIIAIRVADLVDGISFSIAHVYVVAHATLPQLVNGHFPVRHPEWRRRVSAPARAILSRSGLGAAYGPREKSLGYFFDDLRETLVGACFRLFPSRDAS